MSCWNGKQKPYLLPTMARTQCMALLLLLLAIEIYRFHDYKILTVVCSLINARIREANINFYQII